MKIVLAPDSFKESLSSIQVCEAMERGVRNVSGEFKVIKLPLADGGEGTVHTLVAATGGQIIEKRVTGPDGKRVNAHFGLLGDRTTAVIEMAQASGLPLLPPEKRNPLHTTTFGTGELIKAALDLDVENIIIGIGGSATNDCGTGMAQALGLSFYHQKSVISNPMTGGLMGAVERIDTTQLDPRILRVKITVACDVDNPLLGPRGASIVYAPQKGAGPDMVALLEKNMQHIINLIEKKYRSVRDVPGAGAAGGLGAGLMAFLNAELKSGINTVLDAVKFENQIADADIIFTGEGKIDEQSAMGKTIHGIVSRASKYNVPVIAIGGSVSERAETLFDKGLLSLFSICNEPMSLQNAISNASRLVEKTTERILRVFVK